MRHLLALTLPLALCGSASSQDSDVFVREKLGHELNALVAGCEALGFSGVVLAAKDDRILLARSCGVADRETGRRVTRDLRFDIGSLAKQFTAAAILRLEEDGELATTDTLGELLPDVPEDKRGILVHHLLTHTSGLPRGGYVGSATAERDDALQKILAAPLQSEPGAQFAYSNLGYILLGAIVELRSGTSFEEYLERELFRRAKMTSTGFLNDAKIPAASCATGYEGPKVHGAAVDGWYSWGLRGAGGVLSTADDLFRWSRELEKNNVLSQASREKLFTPFRNEYAYGWNVTQTAGGAVWHEHGGTTRGFLAKLYRFPEHGATMVWLANDTDVGYYMPVQLGKALLGEEYRSPPTVVELRSRQLDALAGEYESGDDRVFVLRDGDALTLLPAGQASVERFSASVPPGREVDPAPLTEKAAKVLAGLESGDAGALEGLLSTRFPNWAARLVDYWEAELASREVIEATLLGSLQERMGSVRSYVLLRCESGRQFFALTWSEGVAVGAHFDEAFPASAPLLPVAKDELVLFDLPSMTERARLRFERRTMVLVVGERELTYERLGD